MQLAWYKKSKKVQICPIVSRKNGLKIVLGWFLACMNELKFWFGCRFFSLIPLKRLGSIMICKSRREQQLKPPHRKTASQLPWMAMWILGFLCYSHEQTSRWRVNSCRLAPRIAGVTKSQSQSRHRFMVHLVPGTRKHLRLQMVLKPSCGRFVFRLDIVSWHHFL